MKYFFQKNGKMHETEPSTQSDLDKYNELLERNTFWTKILALGIIYFALFVTSLVFWIAWKDILTRVVYLLA